MLQQFVKTLKKPSDHISQLNIHDDQLNI